jgi:hypothetical protein
MEKAAACYNIVPAGLKTAGKQSTITLRRRVLCYLAARKLMLSCTEVARDGLSYKFLQVSCYVGLNRREVRSNADTNVVYKSHR